MSLYLTTNPYQGVNAHFNSYLQTTGQAWQTFHNNHITYLTNEMNRALPAGYYAVSEASLQIQNRYEAETLPSRPDVSLFQTPPPSSTASTGIFPAQGALAVLEKATLELASPSQELSAVEIYALQSPQTPPAHQLVLRLELLSPTNKRQAGAYLLARQRFLRLGIHCVDLDFLHQQPPLFADLPPYPQEGSYPYWIVVSDASPPQGWTRFYAWGLDEALPSLYLPLRDGQGVVVNFDSAYQAHFATERRAHSLLDYAAPPLNMQAYSPADQAKILALMAQLAAN
jgi:hypothetical protein